MGAIQDEIEAEYALMRRTEQKRDRELRGGEFLQRIHSLTDGIGPFGTHFDHKIAELEGLVLLYIRDG